MNYFMNKKNLIYIFTFLFLGVYLNLIQSSPTMSPPSLVGDSAAIVMAQPANFSHSVPNRKEPYGIINVMSQNSAQK